MSHPLELAVTRIFTTNGQVVGAGCMMLPEYMATCVHVVATALGLKTAPTEIPKTTIIFDFPLVEAGRQLRAEVVIWDIDKDIAGLRVIDALPDGVLPCLPQQGEDLWEHRFRAFGFPENNGVWIRGSLLATETSGRLQLEVDRLTGYAVAPGFSGGPVWDDTLDSLVGLIATADLRETIRTAFVIPAQQLFAAWPELSQVRLETDLTPVQADIIQPQPTAERGELHESLLGAEQSVYGGRNVQIAISQMFRMADLLTRPHSVKACSFYDAITDVSSSLSERNFITVYTEPNLC